MVSDIRECHERGQPVLVGTTSIENSELVSKLLDNPGDSVGRSERIPTDLIVRESCGG